MISQETVIKYTSPNHGYTGILYGKTSMRILDPDGNEVLHTGSRNVNSLEELIPLVENYETLRQRLSDICLDDTLDDDAEI